VTNSKAATRITTAVAAINSCDNGALLDFLKSAFLAIQNYHYTFCTWSQLLRRNPIIKRRREESKPDSVPAIIYLEMIFYFISARLLGGCPYLEPTGSMVKRFYSGLQQVGLPVSLPLVSVVLRSCQFKTCSKLHMRVKSLDTSACASELALRPLLPAVWTFLPAFSKKGRGDRSSSRNQA